MEESSEAHMETDVSSTTEDGTETQEVTGSNGNVEMIVIVEKVSEEEDNSSQQSDSQPPLVSLDASESDTSATIPPSISPKKMTQNILQSPSKTNEIQKTPVKPPLNQSPCKVTQLKIIEDISVAPDQSETAVDSSNKAETQKSPEKSLAIMNVPTETAALPTDVVHVDMKIDENTSLVKLQMSDPSSYTQELLKMSPSKENQVQQVVQTMSNEYQLDGKVNLNGQIDDNQENQDDISDIKHSSSLIESIDKEATNESLSETHSESSEKEHNKSISRELKSLIKSAKESKIISECTQLTSKTRKSRVPLDASNSGLNVSVEADKINDNRRSSDNSQKSTCSEKSEKVVVKRSMRSQNPEFVNKVKQFLNSVTSKGRKEADNGTDEEVEENKSQEHESNFLSSSPTSENVAEHVQENTSKLRSDPYCWRCHWAVEHTPNEKSHPPMTCTVCPRAYHYKCLNGVERSKIIPDKSWVCPECMAVLHAESSETRSPAMKKISLGKLCELLNFAIERMMALTGVKPFMRPVDRTIFPDYDKYVVHPMDLALMEDNIQAGNYGSTEAFMADVQWILHNSIIFNTCEKGFVQSKLTAAARTLVRACRAEMGEIEACPECYAAAHAMKPTWFTDVCTTPHILLWAKLKGFPYWPAKGMSVNASGLVDVRFFGAHDRAWVPAKDCFLYSEKDPNNFRTKRLDILDSMREAKQHIRNITKKYGQFVYPPFKTQFEPTKLKEQLIMMIPSFDGEVRAPIKDKPVTSSPSVVKHKSRSNSKSSKGSHNEGDVSESEEASAYSEATSRKMADGAVIAKEDEDLSEDKDNTMEVDTSTSTAKEETSRKRRRSEKDKDKTMEVDTSSSAAKEGTSRKRRRSEMEEAVITIIDSSSCTEEKKKRLETEENKVDEVKQVTDSPVQSRKIDLTSTPKEKDNKTQCKDNEPSSSTNEKDKIVPPLSPIKLVISTKTNKPIVITKVSNAKDNKVNPIKLRQIKIDKSFSAEKVKSKDKTQRRRSSKTSKSLNISDSANTSKTETQPEKRSERKNANCNVAESVNGNKGDVNKSMSEKEATESKDTTRSVKDRIQFDDDTSLAVIARESKTNNSSGMVGMPTISSVRSLSKTPTQKTSTTSTKTVTNPKLIEITVEANSETNTSLITPSSVDDRNAKDPANKSKSLPNDKQQRPFIGRVGVRAFARMTSPDSNPKKSDASPNASKNLQIEIKTEPMDTDDAERHMEKMDLMNAFRLQPVKNATSLREVRINKVTATSVNAKKTVKPSEVRPRAKKTFPQPKKPDDGRTELNSKNSMVYIPIQPPVTPGPVRGSRMTPVSVSNGPNVNVISRTMATVTNTTSCSNAVNSVLPTLAPSLPNVSAPAPIVAPPSAGVNTSMPLVPSVGQMPTNVHTVPLITSVNGQWTFSLQPVMSVGGVDVLIQDDAPQPLLNGLPDRSNAAANIVPIVPTPVVAPNSNMLVPPAPLIKPTMPAILPSSGPSVSTTAAASLPSIVPSPIVAPNRTTESTAPGEPPRLQQRPVLLNPLDAQTSAGMLPPPSSAGPITAKLNQNAVKLADFFRNLLEDSLEKVDEPEAEVVLLKLKLEQNHWRHRQEVEELKHNHELTLAEVRSSFEKEKARLVSEVRVAAQADLEAAVKAAKSKQWCANCNQEAQFYCCWNTSYCDYPCQRAHWSQHYPVCTQQRLQDADGKNIGSPPQSRLQPQPDNQPKTTTAPSVTPTLTIGTKAPINKDQGPKSGSIIINLEKDTSGNQKLKCVGTYKPTGQAQISPVVLNQQIKNNEDASKKVVTSGGYLIVGTSNNSSTVTPPRRTHTIQYYT